MQLDLVPRETPLWHGAADLVHQTFSERFDAAVSADPDAFLVARPTPSDGADRQEDGATEEVLACSGVNFGTERPFFSEYYLDDSAEQVISDYLGAPCERDDILEFGAIASQAFSAGTEMVKAMPVFTWALGKVYALCTLTRPLTRLIERVGYPFEPLAEARQDRLPVEDQDRWGNYYEQEPRTGIIRLDDVSLAFNSSIGRYQLPELSLTILEDAPVSASSHPPTRSSSPSAPPSRPSATPSATAPTTTGTSTSPARRRPGARRNSSAVDALTTNAGHPRIGTSTAERLPGSTWLPSPPRRNDVLAPGRRRISPWTKDGCQWLARFLGTSTRWMSTRSRAPARARRSGG